MPEQPTFQDLINAVIQTESSGNPHARGKAGELGLMQILPSTGQRYGVRDPRMLLDPKINKAVGGRILTDLLKRYKGNVGLALAAYNGGPEAVKSNVVPAAATGYVNKVLSRLGSALSPASASAAETSNVKEVPAVGPPADIDTRIKAKLADRSRAPSGDIDARIEAKLGAAPSAPPSKPPLPLAVRAADWLPVAGQAIGEYGGEAAGAAAAPLLAPFIGPAAAAAPAAVAGLGGGALEGAGEEIDTGVRALAGQPYKSQPEIGKDAAIAGAVSAVGVPAGKALAKVGEVVAPSTLKAAIAAKRAFGASREALDTTMKKLSDLLGMDAKAAAVASASPLERRQVRAAFLGARQAGFDQAGKVYQGIAKNYVGRMTPNASAVGYSNFSNKYGARSLGLLDNGIDFTRPSWRMIQQFRSNVRKMLRHLPPDSGNMASDLRMLERGATSDMKAIMTPEDSRRLDLIDQWNSDLHANMPDQMVRAVVTAPNAPKAMEAIIKSEPSQVDTLMRSIDRLPMADRVKKLTALKKAVGEWVHEEGMSGKSYVEQLNKYDAALNAIPAPAMNRLYGPGTKESMHKIVETTLAFHKKMLDRPDLITAIQAEMRAKPLPWIVSHGRWVAFSALEGIAAYNRSPEAAALGLVFGLGPGAMHVLLNNSMAQKLYMMAITAESPKAIAAGFRTLLIALASQQMRGPIHDPETHVMAEP